VDVTGSMTTQHKVRKAGARGAWGHTPRKPTHAPGGGGGDRIGVGGGGGGGGGGGESLQYNNNEPH
jgi:hypothetical protein